MTTALPRIELTRHPHRLALRRLRPPARLVLGRRFDVHVEHAERVPATGPVILAANHVGWFDGPMLTVFSPRPVHVLTKEEMFQGRSGRFFSFAGQIALDRRHPDPAAIKAALRVLADDGVLGIFPEGARGRGEHQRIRGGAAYLALVSGAPVVPVTLFGTRQPGRDSQSRPPWGTRIDLVYGEPWVVEPQPWPRRKATVAETSARLRQHLLAAVVEAKQITGRDLPGPLPAGDSERAEAARQDAQP